jgi:catechol 2,3-dioxygenase-like lactoylglutathione lyase family enzyme
VQPGSADLCFLTEDDVSEVRKRLVKADVEMVDLGGAASDDGTVMRTGARGRLRSVYCRDPDGNLIESVSMPFKITARKLIFNRISNYVE